MTEKDELFYFIDEYKSHFKDIMQATFKTKVLADIERLKSLCESHKDTALTVYYNIKQREADEVKEKMKFEKAMRIIGESD